MLPGCCLTPPGAHWRTLVPMNLLRAATLVLTVVCTGCAINPPQPGAARDEVLRAWGAPTARYGLPEGAERLEYATGPFGRTTWMVDISAAGRVQQARQVLNEADFLRVQSTIDLKRDRKSVV